MTTERILKYRVLGELGKGGMASVLLGLDESLQRKVAIKALHPHLMQDAEAKERFRREATTIAALDHPNIVKIFDYSLDEKGDQYIVMEYVDGPTLSQFLSTRHIRFPEIASCVGIQIAKALKHAHSQGVVHRDLKPENIMINKGDGALKLTDFGIARLMSGQRSLTITSAVIGSPAYMSPEVIEGGEADIRSDIFSLGILLYEIAVGKLPFEGANQHALLKAIFEGSYRNPEETNPLISREFRDVVSRCMKRNPDERFQNAGEALDALKKICSRYKIEDPDKTAEEYFKAPDKTEEAYSLVLKAALEAYAVENLEKSNKRAAIAHCNRLFILDPSSRIARDVMEKVVMSPTVDAPEEEDEPPEETISRTNEVLRTTAAKRRNNRPFYIVAAVLLLLLTAAAVLYSNGRSLKNDRTQTPPAAGADTNNETKEPVKPDEKANPGILGLHENIKPELNQGSKQLQNLTVGEQKQLGLIQKQPELKIKVKQIEEQDDKKRETKKGIVRIITSPWASVYIDDQYKGDTPIVREFELTQGEHLLRFENPCCETFTKVVNVSQGGEVIEIRKKLRIIGYLMVKSQPGMEVFVDGVFYARTPMQKPVGIGWDWGENRKTINVELRKSGVSVKSAKVTLESGKVKDADFFDK